MNTEDLLDAIAARAEVLRPAMRIKALPVRNHNEAKVEIARLENILGIPKTENPSINLFSLCARIVALKEAINAKAGKKIEEDTSVHFSINRLKNAARSKEIAFASPFPATAAPVQTAAEPAPVSAARKPVEQVQVAPPPLPDLTDRGHAQSSPAMILTTAAPFARMTPSARTSFAASGGEMIREEFEKLSAPHAMFFCKSGGKIVDGANKPSVQSASEPEPPRRSHDLVGNPLKFSGTGAAMSSAAFEALKPAERMKCMRDGGQIKD